MKGRFLLQIRHWQLWLARRGKVGSILFRYALWAPRTVGLGPFWDWSATFEFFHCGFFQFLFEPLYILYKHFHSRTMYSGNNLVPAHFTRLFVLVLEQSEQSFPFVFCALLNISVCELKICLLLSLKFSIDREELMSHVRHTICISYFKRKAILHLDFGVYLGPWWVKNSSGRMKQLGRGFWCQILKISLIAVSGFVIFHTSL